VRTELEEILEHYEYITGVEPDIHAHWTSVNHVNWRRLVVQYRKLKNAGIILYDEMGNRRFLKKHKI
jgi:hypothetical protein